jgi:hypothetical protein
VHGKPGVSIVFSDFLFESGYERGLSFIQAARQEVTLVHMLAEEERVPRIQGDLRLVDSETQIGREIALTPPLLEAYYTAVHDYKDNLARFAFSRGMTYVDVEPEQTVEQIIFQVFQQSGLIR